MISLEHLCLITLLQICLSSHVSFHVRYLDKKVCEGIQNPVLKGGKYLFRDILDLAVFLQRIEHDMKDNKKDSDQYAKDILEEGGLQFPNVTQDNLKIMEAFNWTLDQAEELRKKTIELADRWHNILKILDRPPVYPVDYDIETDKFVNPLNNNTNKVGSRKRPPPKTCKGWEEMACLSYNITQRIQHPSGDSLCFIEDIQIYYECLEKVMEGIKNNTSENIEDYLKIKESGGPEHLKLYPVSSKHLETFYEWNTFTTWQFRGLMKYTWVLWLDLQDLMCEPYQLIKLNNVTHVQ